MTPRPYLPMNAASQISQAGIDGVVFVALEHRQHEVMIRCRFIDEAAAS